MFWLRPVKYLSEISLDNTWASHIWKIKGNYFGSGQSSICLKNQLTILRLRLIKHLSERSVDNTSVRKKLFQYFYQLIWSLKMFFFSTRLDQQVILYQLFTLGQLIRSFRIFCFKHVFVEIYFRKKETFLISWSDQLIRSFNKCFSFQDIFRTKKWIFYHLIRSAAGQISWSDQLIRSFKKRFSFQYLKKISPDQISCWSDQQISW